MNSARRFFGRFALAVLCGAFTAVAAPVGYVHVSNSDLGLPSDFGSLSSTPVSREVPGRRIPPVVAFSNLTTHSLASFAVPLPAANTLAHVYFQQRQLGRITFPDGSVSYFNPQTLLVQFRDQPLVSALRVEPGREWDALQLLRQRSDVLFAEFDTFERRQFSPDDPLLSSQWHHQMIGSFRAWDIALGSASVRVAIVDSPFQMDHPDLAANTDPGWDAVVNAPITNSPGMAHSTLCAGMAAAVINNGLGVAGAANCRVLPININGAISEMYNATLWAASHGVRVVNISWSGATNDVLEAAGLFLKTNANGLLVMSAVDGEGSLGGPNQPDVWCVSMTDAADNFQVTLHGPYIDFAAPGYDIFSTAPNSSYASGSGCSYAAPLVAGIMAWMFGLNPTLYPSDVIDILTNSAVDLGPPGWDEYYGWGRIDFGAAASATLASLPNVTGIQYRATAPSISVTANFRPGLRYSLWRAPALSPGQWSPVASLSLATNGSSIILTDSNPPPFVAFYRIQASR